MEGLWLTPAKAVLAFKIFLASFVFHILNSNLEGCDRFHWVQLLFGLLLAEVVFSIASELLDYQNNVWQFLSAFTLLAQFGWHCIVLYWQFTSFPFIVCDDLDWNIKMLQAGWLGCTVFALVLLLLPSSNK
jgi:hypothetical protein